MKKIKLLLCILFLLLLAGCGNKETDKLDCKSIKDTTKNVIISIGEHKSSVDKKLGEGIYNAELDGYDYTNNFLIEYDISDLVIYIQSENPNIELLNYKDGDTQEDIERNYEFVSFNVGLDAFYAYYDEKEMPCDIDDAKYYVAIIKVVNDGDFVAAFIDGGEY
jgi:hypothetical protein